MFNPSGPKDKPLCMEFQKDICMKLLCTLEHKYWPCPDYDKGFCYLGSSCDKLKLKHIVRKLCMDYVYGFCKDGPECKMQHVKLFDLNDRTQELRFTERFYSKLKQEQATFKQSEINVKPVICKSCQEVGHKSNVCKKTLRLSPNRKILCGICETEHTIYDQGKKQDCQYKISQSQQQLLFQQQSSEQ
ncbi:unnamed protein product (macronuclear) [Paramecium tetraurelia]|uniref:C3H1-type domain-containing protein n=1 Tax=Paramecium tetraurelia TaxID=5888 RepID=A0DK00_PARTE|nr:uncharacterized protein GSPATT00017711001 [Paramecium tetraurelia]CAK83367.1 unnamed protein product [Paramecium tetraurelia]|eukprot:XP_001450764.1 hypothetical protein (macronuclear) [Paramecium tetraurelia strain d4-2]